MKYGYKYPKDVARFGGGGGGGFDADYQAVLDRGTTLGYTLPSSGQQTNQNALVLALKSAGVWTKLDTFYVFATDGDSDFATLNWIAPSSFQCTKVNAPTFTTDQGFTGDQSSSYLDSNYTPSTDATNMTLNSTSAGVWIRSFSTGNNYVIGGRDSGGTEELAYFDRTGVARCAVNRSMSTALQDASPTLGMIHANRSGASAEQIYNNGSLGDTSTDASVTLIDRNMFFLARNLGTADQYSDAQISMGFFGADLSSEAADFYAAVNTYMGTL